MELFPGSAGDDSRVAPWVLHTQGEAIYSLHIAPSADAFAGFWLALEAILSQELLVDRGNPQHGPGWLRAEIVDPRSGEGLAPLTWGGRDLPMGPSPRPLEPGSVIRFQVPLEIRMDGQEGPPAMAHWLRLGRNRLARLARQSGRPVWTPEDARWRLLSESAQEARWSWSVPERGAEWGLVPKHHFKLSDGWRGQARIEDLPETWRSWAALLPLAGVGSHIPFGCGVGTVLAPLPGKLAEPPPAPSQAAKLALHWRAGFS